MKNSIYHSDYNPLHFVTYDFQDNPKYNFKTIYQDWFNNRNDAWVLNPDYIQKFQTTETILDQIVSNGVSNIVLRMYDCRTATLIDTFIYTPVVPAPISGPEVVLQVQIIFSSYPEDQYFFVMAVNGTPVTISERIHTKSKWDGTILIESSNSINKTGIFFSTGFKTILRVEGLVKKLQPSVEMFVANEESGDSELLYSQVSRKRTIRFGTAYGLPDYLYLKVADAITLDDFKAEGVNYVLENGEKITPSDDISGHPLYYYNVNVTPSVNTKGYVFPGSLQAERTGVVLVVDASAFGLPPGSLINIDVE